MEFPANVDMGLEPLLEEQIKKEDKIVVFSYTKTSRYIVDTLDGYEVMAMLDNNADLSGTEYKGIRVYTPQEYLSGEHKDDIKIIGVVYRHECTNLDKVLLKGNRKITVIRDNWNNDLYQIHGWELCSLYAVGELPYTILIDKNGVIRKIFQYEFDETNTNNSTSDSKCLFA